MGFASVRSLVDRDEDDLPVSSYNYALTIGQPLVLK